VVLSEEGADDPARLAAERVWIVDPLDGTKEFGEPGRTDWAVHVALWERSEAEGAGDLSAGAVALPAQGRVLSTLDPPSPVDADEAPGRIRVVLSRTRAPRFVLDISELMNVELLPLGSAGAKVAAVVCGEADAYIHGGGFYEWDTAAPVAVARAAGLHASRIDGSALAYNQVDVLMPDILVCRPALAGSLLQAIREVTHAS
jgi:3'(2'), 5'-bisphosphate nucleotidase